MKKQKSTPENRTVPQDLKVAFRFNPFVCCSNSNSECKRKTFIIIKKKKRKNREKQSTLEKRDNEAEKSSKVVLGSGVNNIAN